MTLPETIGRAAPRPRQGAALRRLALGVALPAAVAALPAPAGAQHLVSFATPDGGAVVADLYGAGDHGVVLVHGGRYDRSSWRPQARALAERGFRVLAIDLRASARARAGERSDCLYDESCLAADVLVAVRYLRAAGAGTVSVVGASLGGGAAAQATVEAREGEIDRVVLLAHMPIAAPARMKGRKLFLVARDDPGPGGAPRLATVRAQHDRAPAPKALVVLDGSAHAQAVFDTAEGERLMREILAFLSAP
jgi:pimeloyl-ACP methyl ester carboxylesterase